MPFASFVLCLTSTSQSTVVGNSFVIYTPCMHFAFVYSWLSQGRILPSGVCSNATIEVATRTGKFTFCRPHIL